MSDRIEVAAMLAESVTRATYDSRDERPVITAWAGDLAIYAAPVHATLNDGDSVSLRVGDRTIEAEDVAPVLPVWQCPQCSRKWWWKPRIRSHRFPRGHVIPPRGESVTIFGGCPGRPELVKS